MLSRPSIVSNRIFATTLLTAAAGVLVAGGMVASQALHGSGDSCAVPLDGLDARARIVVARRTMACHDYEHGRITKDDYHRAIAAIDAEFVRQPERATVMWASSVLGFSSQYSEDSWSARQALGVPNVYPQHGDLAHAWASRGPDDNAEWIELGYASPHAVSAVEIYETFNPGAVDTVELITTSGRRIELHPQGEDVTKTGAAKLVIETACTTEPIAAVRVNLASQNITGWNEIDAVGLVPCSER